MRGLVFGLVVFCVLLGCAPSPVAPVQPQSQPQQPAAVKKEDTSRLEDELFNLVSRPIAIKYYDFKHKPVVRVFMGQFSSDVDDSGLIKAYVGALLEDGFKKANQFRLAEMLDDSVDAYIEGNIQAINKDKFRIIIQAYDNKSSFKVADIVRICDYSQLNSDGYALFKAKYKAVAETKKNIGNTRLIVAVNASGKSLDSYETTFRSTYRSSSEYSGSAQGSFQDSDDYSAEASVSGQAKGSSESEFAIQEKTGRVGAYPSEIQVYFNGKYFKPNSYGVAYDQNIYPGKYDVVVSFRETFWDSSRLSEIKGKKHEKKFQVEIKKDKTTTFNVVVAYDGKTAKILPNLASE